MQCLTTPHGLTLPKLGLGTWPMVDAPCTEAVLSALELGYRHIDTAAAYGNEAAVGAALARTGVPRRDIHVTTKVWWDQLEPAAMRASLARSLETLGDESVDLFMIHWPGAEGWDLAASIETLMALHAEGLTRHIGVANFPLPLLRQVVEEICAPLAAIQVEYHVLLGQQALLDYARAQHMALIAYSPLARNRVSEWPAIQTIARKHRVLPTQVALAWLLEQDAVAAIPKAASRANQQANLDALQLRLDDEDRRLIAALPRNQRLVSPAFAPRWDA